MIGGAKRRSVSLRSNADDSAFKSKRVIAESPFGGQAVTPPHVEAAVSPSLDRRRAARQHLRALNTEFASWVQSQLQDHPDELWEDGVRAYLDHASDILEKFTDVVNWLKTNTGKEGSVSILGSSCKKNPSEIKSKEPKSLPEKFVFGSPSTNATLTTSLNSGAAGTQTSTHGSPPSSSPSWSFGLTASSQPLSQSPSAGLTTSWSSGAFSNGKSLSPVKTVTFSASPFTGVSSNNETASLTTTASVMSSSSSGVLSNSQTQSFGTTPSLITPRRAGALSNSQAAFKFGNNSSAPSNDGAKDNADEDNEPEQPSSPSLKRSEEKGIVVVHETKCKLYLKSTDPDDKEPWKDKGMGQLFIKCQEGASKGTKESKPIILVRNDVGRIMLNASLYPGIKTNLQKNAIVAIFHTSDDSGGENGNAKAVPRTFLVKTKNQEERNKLADAIRFHAPAS